MNFDPTTDDHGDDDDVRTAALRAMLDVGIRELDAGLGAEMSPEDLMAQVIAELSTAGSAAETAATHP